MKQRQHLSPSSRVLPRKNRVKIVAKIVDDDEKDNAASMISNNNKKYKWAVVGCDSDAGGALAIIRGDFVGDVQTVEIVDVPTMTVSVNGKARRRLDVAKMIEKVRQWTYRKIRTVVIRVLSLWKKVASSLASVPDGVCARI